MGVLLKVVCAWCGKVMQQHYGDERPSHGICKRCFREETGEDLWDLWIDIGGEG